MSRVRDLLAQAQSRATAARGGVVFSTKIPKGKSLIRILPGVQGSEQEFFRSFGRHYAPGKKQADGTLGRKKVVFCPKLNGDDNCDICDFLKNAYFERRTQLIEGGIDPKEVRNDEVIKMIRSFESGQHPSWLMNVVFVSSEDSRVKVGIPTILEVSNRFLTENMMDAIETFDGMNGFEGDHLGALDPEVGCTFQVIRTGEGIDTKYSIRVADKRDQSVIIEQSTLMKRHDLNAFVNRDTDADRQEALSLMQEALEPYLNTESGDESADEFATSADTSVAETAATLAEELKDDIPDEFSGASVTEVVAGEIGGTGEDIDDKALDDILAGLGEED